jgi:hypothetical protein
MTKEETVERTKALLKSFHSEGLRQIEVFKELNPGGIRRTLINGSMMGEINGIFMPIEDVVRRINTQEEIFLHNILQGFWDYYLLNIEYIESPARQGIDRTLLELCYQKLIPFIQFTPAEKKRMLLINGICDVGVILARPSDQDRKIVPQYTDDYNFWVTQLSREADREWFKKLQDENYPTHAFTETKRKLWPSFSKAYSDNTDELIFPWAGGSKEDIDRARSGFLTTYQHQHDFVHGSHTAAISAVEAITTRKHLFSSVIISTQVGYQVLHTINKAFLGERAVKLDELYLGASKIVPQLAKHYSYTNAN